jgi:hypothetical protein
MQDLIAGGAGGVDLFEPVEIQDHQREKAEGREDNKGLKSGDKKFLIRYAASNRQIAS